MSQAVERQMRAAEWAMLLLLSVLWGGSFVFVGVAVEALPPFTLVFLRVALAAAALQLLLRLAGRRMPAGRRVWSAFFGMALLNNVVPFSLLVWGQTQIAGGLAAILNATTPLWTVAAAHFLTADETVTPQKLLGVGFGISGVALMIGVDALAGVASDLPAQFACLAAALSYALAGIFGRRFRTLGVPPLATATGQVSAASLVLLPLALLADRPWRLAMPGGEVWAAVAGLALLSTAAAYVLYFRILAAAGATNLLLVTFLIPVTAILLGGLVLGETLEPGQLIGMALIGAGLAAIDGRLARAILRRGVPGASRVRRPRR